MIELFAKCRSVFFIYNYIVESTKCTGCEENSWKKIGLGYNEIDDKGELSKHRDNFTDAYLITDYT